MDPVQRLAVQFLIKQAFGLPRPKRKYTKRALVVLLLVLLPVLALAQSISSGGVGALPPGGGSVDARFACRSFGQTVVATAGTPGNITIDYATPMMCWGYDSTVNSVNVNNTGWVPEVHFDWGWDDTSLGSVTRGGVSTDLGKSVGLVAAHAFRPLSFSTCGGGSGSNRVVSLTVRTPAFGSSTAYLNVCVRNPSVTWPAPVAFCDDADCSNDPGVPAGTVHGGNLTDLGTILRKCDVDNTPLRVVLKAGVTFTTPSDQLSVGEQNCLVESYGTGGAGKAILHFTSTSGGSVAIDANHANCAGFRLNNVTFAGSGGAPILFGASVADTGCLGVVDSNVSETPGELFEAMALNDPGPPNPNGVARELYFIKFDYTKTDSTIPLVFLYSDYVAFVGGSILDANSNPEAEHNLRLPQWHYVVIDAMKFADQQYCRQTNSGPGSESCSQEGGQGAKELVTLRQDCGGSTSCPHSSDAAFFAITRSEFLAYNNGVPSNTSQVPGSGRFSGAVPIQVCTSGSGSGGEQTKCYDGDIIGNSFGFENDEASQDYYVRFSSGGSAGSETQRIRGFMNAIDESAMSTTSNGGAQMFSLSAASQVALIGNVLASQSAHTSARLISSGGPSQIDIAKGNVCWENGAASCNMFPNLTEDPVSNPSINSSTEPFDGAACAGLPGTYASFFKSQLCIGASSPLEGVGDAPPWAIDLRDGDPCNAPYDAGLDCNP